MYLGNIFACKIILTQKRLCGLAIYLNAQYRQHLESWAEPFYTFYTAMQVQYCGLVCYG